jgi:hypothetical protein
MERYRFTDGRMDRVAPPRRSQEPEQHYHIYLPDDRPRGGARDANAGAPGELRTVPRPNGNGGFDQEEEPCILQQSNDNARLWTGRDQRTGRTYAIRARDDGTLELHVRHPSGGEETEATDEIDPDITGHHPAEISGEAKVGAAHDSTDRTAWLRMKRLGHASTPDMEYSANRHFAATVSAYYQQCR